MTPFEMPKRRRIFLMRHGDVTYFDDTGRAIDPETVPLNAHGLVQAKAAGEAFAADGARFDRGIVSAEVYSRIKDFVIAHRVKP